MFPDGEDFFVRSVRHYRDQITDPELKRQVNGFIGQEAMHGREHRAFNDRLDELGYPTKRVRAVHRARAWRSASDVLPPHRRTSPPPPRSSTSPPRSPSSCSADEETRGLFGHDEVRNLFLWHALEESEHKAVAFDVYRAVGGSERLRVLTMNLLRVGFVVGMAVQVVVSLLGDRDTYRAGQPAPQLAPLPALAARVTASVWDQLRTTTGPTSTPTTATPPSSSSSGAPSCSAPTARSTTSSPDATTAA